METDHQKISKITDFLYELGTMRKLPRMHRQTLLTEDPTDTIASHTYRVAMIGWHLAKIEGADPYKVMLMCMLHDVPEIRSGDHNYIHKKYVKIYENEIMKDQLGELPFADLLDTAEEYHARESVEARLAKDADLVDQILLLCEYRWQGNKEAEKWLKDSHTEESLKKYSSKSAKDLVLEILQTEPSRWWESGWTRQNR